MTRRIPGISLAFLCFLVFGVLAGCEGTLTGPDAAPDAAALDEEAKPNIITLESGVRVEKRKDDYLWEGDIILSDRQLELLRTKGSIFSDSQLADELVPDSTLKHPSRGYTETPSRKSGDATAHSFGIYPTSYNMWAMVRYVLSPNLTYSQRQNIATAISRWEANTDVRFYNATGEPTVDPTYGFEYPYVYFRPGDLNSSALGRKGGRQNLNLVPRASVSTVMHEIGHAIGLVHEQSRFDRDNHVDVHYNNIESGKGYNFDKRTQNYSAIGSFDFESIMIYSSFAFSKNGNPTITKKDGSTFGRNYSLSSTDIAWANQYYYPYEE